MTRADLQQANLDRPNLIKQGLAFYHSKNLDEAQKIFEYLTFVDPRDHEALHLLGLTFHNQSNYSVAIDLILRSTKINPFQPHAFNNLGNVYVDVGQPHVALKNYLQALNLDPSFVEAHNNCGLTLSHLKRYDEALKSYQTALSLNPNSPEIFFNQGITLDELGQFEIALASYKRAISLKPDYAECHNNCGIALKELKRFPEAITSYTHAINFKPSYAQAYNNRGIAYKELKLFDEALKNYDIALSIEPTNPEFRWNKSQLLLLLGQYIEGWQLYESRWKKDSFRPLLRKFQQPLWNGEHATSSLDTILLHAEQGLGDTIQMLRFVPLVAERGWNIVLEVPKSLFSVACSIPGVAQVISTGTSVLPSLPGFKTHCPLMSLPYFLKTTIETIPQVLPYLSAPNVKKESWSQTLKEFQKLKVGICWAGSPHHKNDYNRSIPLTEFLPLLHHDADFFSLQKDLRPGDKEILSKETNVKDYTNEFNDFSDTAAFIDSLDLVITVDTSVAHLAGALNKPVWIALLYSPDFRWRNEGGYSPWYPSAKLFRQQKVADWDNVFKEMKKSLQTVIDSRNR